METTNKQEFQKKTGATMHGMTHRQIQDIAKEHMAEFSPTRFKRLKREGLLDEKTGRMAEKVLKGIESLKNHGFQHHEAESMMMREHVRLTPEAEMVL